METLTRHDDGGINTVPRQVLDLVPIFLRTGITPVGIKFVVDLFGDDGANTLADYAASLTGLKRDQYLGQLLEGWASPQPIKPVLEVLAQVDVRLTYRAVIAQRISQQHPELVKLFTPFYRQVCGVSEPTPKEA